MERKIGRKRKVKERSGEERKLGREGIQHGG